MSDGFSHIDSDGNPSMVDVGSKDTTARVAIAEASVFLPDEVFEHFSDAEIHTKKGPVFQTAILAGIMASKKTSELIPLCHPLGLDQSQLDIKVSSKNMVRIRSTARITGKTGVEMEALTGASIAALTIYDMCKAFSHDIVIQDIKLIHKSGGKREYTRK